MRYKAIIFDLDNTLLDYDRCEADSMHIAGRHHGLEQWDNFNWETFWGTFSPINWIYWSERNERKLTIHQVLELSFRDTLERLERDIAMSQPLASTYWEHFCRLCYFEEGAKELLEELHGQHKLAIISNGIGESQRQRTANGGIAHLFDAFIVSDEVGLWKPDRTIFEIALQKLGVDRSEALYIGDSLNDDYEGAHSAGIDFCFYNRNKSALDVKYQPRYKIERLSELHSIVKGGIRKGLPQK